MRDSSDSVERCSRKKKSRRQILKPLSLISGAVFLLILTLWAWASLWFVHHPRAWLEERCRSWPRLATHALLWMGEPLGDVTDGIGLTGADAVQVIDRPAPTDKVLFAGTPVRRSAPAPEDITILDRGDFCIGWSPRLRHPVWVAYHVPASARYESGKRPNFKKDPAIGSSPTAAHYAKTGYDRGHMAPNFAIATRFGPEAQSKTFLMSNISPQTPALNRGLWRDIEHRIAELWSNRWGELWIIVGCISDGQETLSGTDIDVPTWFYQVIVAQDGNEVRAMALLLEQNVPWKGWPTRYLVTIDELEELTGLDFLADLPDDIEDALEAQRPTRLWPIRFSDILRQISLRGSSSH